MADHVGGLLIRAGLITQNQLLTALSARRRFGGTLAEHLILSRAVDEVALAEFYRDRLLVPAIIRDDLSRARPSVLARVPGGMAEEFRVVPVALDREGSLVLAMVDPSDTHVADEVGFFAECIVVRAVATFTDIRWAIEHHYHLKLAPPSKLQRIATGSATLSAAAAASTSASRPLVDPQAPHAPSAPITIAPAPTPAEDGDVPVIPLTRRKHVAQAQLEEILPEEPVIALAAPKAAPAPSYIPEETTLKFRPQPAKPPARETEGSVIVTLDPEELAPIEGVVAEIAAAATPDAVSTILLQYLAARCRRAVFFEVDGNVLRGREGLGPGVRTKELRAAKLPLDRASLFQSIIGARLPYRGPITDPPARDFVIDALGYAPREVLAIPIAVRENVVGLIYGDEVHTPIADPALAILAQRASATFERLIQTRR